MPAPLSPVFCVGNRLQDCTLRHVSHHLILKLDRSFGCTHGTKPRYDWPPVPSPLQARLLATAHCVIKKTGFLFKGGFHRTHQTVGAMGPSACSGICLDRSRGSRFGRQTIPEPIKAQGAAHENFTCLDCRRQLKNGNDLQLASVEQLFGMVMHEAIPLARQRIGSHIVDSYKVRL